MTTLKYLRHSILIACFLNLIFALTHWARHCQRPSVDRYKLRAQRPDYFNGFVEHDRFDTSSDNHAPPATTNLADQLCCPTDCLSDRVVMSIVHIGCVLSSLIAN
ncbi:hypothetical protein LAP9435_2410 [Lactiplantibacillus plantarum]|nr:hypothetical protein LAP8962_02317 [Lactiplantibacillus plantarum]VFI64681.1 hypothetical protein LAP9434_02413 [Lactiplantibacillus plantarum]VFQ57396.1 hypothetical protein LAP9435_2410 [Lactiplantibacillus plantarum]